MADVYKQFPTVFSRRSPTNRVDWTLNPENLDPTSAQIDDFHSKLQAGARFIVVKDEKVISNLSGNTNTLKKAGSMKVEGLGSWSTIKSGIPYQLHMFPNGIRAEFKSRVNEINGNDSCESEDDSSKEHPSAIDKQVMAFAVNFSCGIVPNAERINVEKIGFNKINPQSSIDAVTDYTTMSNFNFNADKGNGIVFVGEQSKEPIVAIEGKKIKTYSDVLLSIDKDIAWVGASKAAMMGLLGASQKEWKDATEAWKGSSLATFEEDESSSKTLINLNIGDMVVKFKKLDKKVNFEIESPVGTTGIRG